MTKDQLASILAAIHGVHIAVYGDFCLDAYWILDPAGGEISVETGLLTEAVRRQYYTLGGASNVVANVAALKPKKISAVGVVGDDIFGREMVGQFQSLAVDTSRLYIQKENYDTVVFSKRYLNEAEQPRIDFGFFNRRAPQTDDKIIAGLREILRECDVLIFNQQVPGGLSDYFIEQANAVFDEFSDKIILLDSRHYGARFRNIYRKTNDIEAALLAGAPVTHGERISAAELEKTGQTLFAQFHKPVFLTRGDRGIQTFDESGVSTVPGIHFMKKLDTVGAGDTVTSALAVALAAGFPPAVAADFANLAAGVTVQKLYQTGTASGEEILAFHRDVYYVHQPELAEDSRRAIYLKNSDIEICAAIDQLDLGHIRHIIFDHDGTISTLREGWDNVMETVMLDCILGEKKNVVALAEWQRVRDCVREFIDMTTGVETMVQMEGLVELVREFGHVAESKILDKTGYKKIYNDALMHIVDQRTERIRKGELEAVDFTIKGAVAFLQKLSATGATLYLASGTDDADVKNEAEILGYAGLFNGGIYGAVAEPAMAGRSTVAERSRSTVAERSRSAVGDVSKFSKRLLIERIIQEHNLRGAELAVFGDGPVELQESRKYGGFAIGIASDEIRRFGLNQAKRTRLIKAGAQFVVADYSQGKRLYNILFSQNQAANKLLKTTVGEIGPD